MRQNYIDTRVWDAAPVWPLGAAFRLLTLRWSERIEGRHRPGQPDECMLRALGLPRGAAERKRREHFREI